MDREPTKREKAKWRRERSDGTSTLHMRAIGATLVMEKRLNKFARRTKLRRTRFTSLDKTSIKLIAASAILCKSEEFYSFRATYKTGRRFDKAAEGLHLLARRLFAECLAESRKRRTTASKGRKHGG